ncbi:DUF389 domain-containing protein [Demequina pelophila]|uniref:DUF389 domain-containing protein n=1 Tax=Demequina pelophila TaxID=1638984 RepID=UPI0007810ED6|nr:DUF389 domain-containing protein [Demequina pelophila]
MEHPSRDDAPGTSGEEAPGPGWSPPGSHPNPQLRSQARNLAVALSNSAAIRGFVAILAGGLVLLAPDTSTELVQTLAIALLTFGGLMDLFYAVTGRRWYGRRGIRWLTALRGLGALLLAVPLAYLAWLIDRPVSLTLLVGLLGMYVGFRGLVAIIGAIAHRHERDPAARLALGAIAVVVGVLSFLVPQSITSGIIATGAVVSLTGGLLLLAWSVRRAAGETTLEPSQASITDILWDWVKLADIGRKERAAQADGLYFEEPQRLTKLGAWWVMLLLSVAIATFAVLADSTAVVIGAMLVAPLMTPIVGLAGALVNGWGRRAFQSAVLVASGVVVSVIFAGAVSRWVPATVTYEANTQIASRINPTTVDMLIALAAGAAGAFATVFHRMASGIAGVAIAVALVPPLAVVGVSLGSRHWADALGALLLFLTNFVAIVLAASIVFVLTGFARTYVLTTRRRQVALTMAPFVVLAGLVLVPLTLSAEGVFQNETRESDAEAAVREWLGEDSELVLTAVALEDDTVKVSLAGAGDPPDPAVLLADLQDVFIRPVGLELQIRPVEIIELEAPGR